MKKLLSLMLALILVAGLTACGAAPAPAPAPETASQQESSAAPEAEPVTLVVFAAASMTETVNQIIEKYKTIAPNVTISANFDSSGTLKTQIQEGADCDLFISAAQKQMNELDISADPAVNKDKLDFVLSDTRINLLENKVTLVVPEGNAKKIENFDAMVAALKAGSVKMAMGNADVPVGQYTSKILAFFKLDEKALATAGLITYGTNVKEVTTQVSEGAVDFGVVYATDAFSAKLTVVDSATAEMCGQVIYPAAVMKSSKNAEAAKAFLEYLKSAEAMEVFKSVGFAPAA